jgi:haloacetate dehalogenase
MRVARADQRTHPWLRSPLYNGYINPRKAPLSDLRTIETSTSPSPWSWVDNLQCKSLLSSPIPTASPTSTSPSCTDRPRCPTDLRSSAACSHPYDTFEADRDDVEMYVSIVKGARPCALRNRCRGLPRSRLRHHCGVSLPGFQEGRRSIREANYFVAEGGSGPPVLLLHGFPETHACWHRVAPKLAEAHCVVAPDLRGYGASEAPTGGPSGEGYTKREMAAEMVELMSVLGYERFAVVGHDRGGRVAYRMALDHPANVERVALLNVVPTIDQFERMGAGPSLGYWTWFLLAQPAPFPERLLLAEPAAVIDLVFATWPSDPAAISVERREDYVRALTPSTAAAMCADFRASFYLDREHEAEDRAAGRRITRPVLVVTGADEKQLVDARDVWRAWTEDLSTTQVPGGHFNPEEAPGEVGEIVAGFLDMANAASGK